MKPKKRAWKTVSFSYDYQSIKSTCYMCSSRDWFLMPRLGSKPPLKVWVPSWMGPHLSQTKRDFISVLVKTAMFLGRPLCRTIVWNILYLIVVSGGREESLTRLTFEQKNYAVQLVKYENNVDFRCLLWFVQSKTLPAEIIHAFHI